MSSGPPHFEFVVSDFQKRRFQLLGLSKDLRLATEAKLQADFKSSKFHSRKCEKVEVIDKSVAGMYMAKLPVK